jgi:hypothetical protein
MSVDILDNDITQYAKSSLEIMIGRLIAKIDSMNIKIDEQSIKFHDLKNDVIGIKMQLEVDASLKIEAEKRGAKHRWWIGLVLGVLGFSGIFEILKHFVPLVSP